MADPAARSRRLAAQSRRRRPWGAAGNDEEARAFLQERLTMFSRLLFWSFVALLAFLFVMYTKYPEVEPQYQDIVYVAASVSLGVLAFLWRGLLVRRVLSVSTLYTIDLVIMIGSGTTFALVALLAWDLRASSYTCLLYQSFTVFTRALVLPSSSRRTAVTSAFAFVPIVVGSIVLAAQTTLEINVTSGRPLPGVAFVAGDLLYNIVAVLLATAGSRIIYDLRRQVSEAMQLGQYTLDRRIGEGGMGAVYRARHALLRRPTAVKLLLPDKVGIENLDRFEREVQAMSQLTHPNTVAVFDYGRSPDGVLYYAMEYLGGIDLERLVRTYGAQPAERVVQILAQVSGALQEAHDAGLIHRDIKPGNIILCERGGVPDIAKVVDFGLVKEITQDSSSSTQVILGTPHYIAPETITDPAAITFAADLYGLGAVGYFLLTGKRLFEGKTTIEVCIQHVTQPPKPIAEVTTRPVPAELEAIIMKCLSKAPSARYASAYDLAEALDALPDLGDWDREEARRWWREFRALEVAPPATDVETITITVDIEHRGLVGALGGVPEPE